MLKHRTFIFLIAFLLTAFLVSPAVAQVRGIVPVPIKNPQGEQVLLYKESYALVVGVSAYEKGWPTLPGVLKDVELVKYALEEKDFNVITVINPSFDELRNAIEKFIHSYGQQEDNRLLFYFAGHGHTLKLSYGDEMGYFVPVNAPNPNRDQSGFLAKSLNMESIEVFAKQIQAKHALFLFDSCFSGSIFALSRAAIPANISYKTSEPVRQFVTAGSANETVPDESIFRDQFIRAIRGEGDSDGDGYVTGVELGEFLQKAVVNYSKGSQHPQYGKIRNPNLDKGDFVFSLLNTGSITNSIAKIAKEREMLQQDRSKIKQERLAAIKRLQSQKQQLELEKKMFKEEKEKLQTFDRKESKQIAALQNLQEGDVGILQTQQEELIGKVLELEEVLASLPVSENSIKNLEPEVIEELKLQVKHLNDEIARLNAIKASNARTGGISRRKSMSTPPRYNQALSSYRAGNYDESILLFQRFLSTNPPERLKDNIIYWIGSSYVKLEMYEDAIGQYEIIINDYSTSSKIHDSRFMLGLSYYRKGENSRAVEILQSALLKNPPFEVQLKILKKLNEIQPEKEPMALGASEVQKSLGIEGDFAPPIDPEELQVTLSSIMPIAFNAENIRVLKFTLIIETFDKANAQIIKETIQVYQKATIRTMELFFKNKFYNDIFYVKEKLLRRFQKNFESKMESTGRIKKLKFAKFVVE